MKSLSSNVIQVLRFAFLLGSTGVPNFRKLGALKCKEHKLHQLFFIDCVLCYHNSKSADFEEQVGCKYIH